MQNGFSRFLRQALPHIVALALFAAVSAIFFAPQYDGKALRQTDMVMLNGVTSDIEQHIEQYGEHPQWAGRNFSGMPSYLAWTLVDSLISGLASRECGIEASFWRKPPILLHAGCAVLIDLMGAHVCESVDAVVVKDPGRIINDPL